MFIVTEIQTNTNGTIGLVNWSYNNRNEAQSKYHTILASAAISNLPKHAAIMFSEEGFPLLNACYKHDVVPVVPDEEEEPEGN